MCMGCYNSGMFKRMIESLVGGVDLQKAGVDHGRSEVQETIGDANPTLPMIRENPGILVVLGKHIVLGDDNGNILIKPRG